MNPKDMVSSKYFHVHYISAISLLREFCHYSKDVDIWWKAYGINYICKVALQYESLDVPHISSLGKSINAHITYVWFLSKMYIPVNCETWK